jgi:cytochrome b561
MTPPDATSATNSTPTTRAAPVQRYTLTAISLHWVIAVLIGCNILLGFIGVHFMAPPIERPMLDLHKSIGLTVLALVFVRAAWRLTHRPPPLPAAYGRAEALAAHTAHYALYFLIFALPITGWIHDSAWSAATQHPFYLYWVIPFIRLGFITGLDPATKEYVHGLFGTLHTWLGYGLYAVLLAHIAGALKHQFVDREPELQRMWRG